MATTNLSAQSLVSCSTTPVATEVNEEVILMSLERDRCYGLGTTGSAIWRLLASPLRVADLWSRLRETYDALPGQLEADVVRTLRELASEGLVLVVND